MTKTILKAAARVACALGIVATFSTASFADARVYVRLGDGRVIRTTRTYWHRQYPTGVVVNALPGGYVGDPYTYNGGYPVYYQQTYWHAHNRHWKGDRDGLYRGGHGHGGHGQRGHGHH